MIRAFPGADSTGLWNDYVNIGLDGLWRQLAANISAALYDNYDRMGNAQKYMERRMVFVTKTEKKLIYNGFQEMLHSRRDYLLRFINRRHHLHLKKKDFKDEKSLISYLLDREAKE